MFYQSIVMVKLDATCFQQRHSIVLLRPILDYDHIFYVNNLISGVWLMLLRDRVAYLNESGRTHLCDMVQPIVAHLARLELQYHEASIIPGGYLSGWIITPIIRNVVLIAITIITWTHQTLNSILTRTLIAFELRKMDQVTHQFLLQPFKDLIFLLMATHTRRHVHKLYQPARLDVFATFFSLWELHCFHHTVTGA